MGPGGMPAPVRPAPLLVTMMVVMASAALSLFAWSAWSDHEDTLAEAEEDVGNVVGLLEEHARRVLQGGDLLALRVADLVQRRDPAAMRGRDQWEAVRKMTAVVPDAASVWIRDAAGDLVLSTLTYPASGGNGAGRENFKAHQSGAEQVIGRAAIGQATAAPPPTGAAEGPPAYFTISRRLTGDGGTFLGVVSVSIDVATFTRLYSRLRMGPGAALSAIRTDGTLLARSPFSVADLERSWGESALFKTQLPKANAGVYHNRSAFDGVERLVAYRLVAGYPIVATAAVAVDDVMAPWRRRTEIGSLLVLAGVGTLLGLTWLALAGVRREEAVRLRLVETAAALDQRSRELERSNAELEEFAQVASHDMQEPLRKVVAFGTLLDRKRDQLDDEGRVYVHHMVDAGTRMQQLVEALMSYARLSSRIPEVRPVALEAVMASVLKDLGVAITEVAARVEVAPLPWVMGDPVQLRRLFQNLVLNALKYRRPERSPTIVIAGVALDSGPDAGRAVVTVSDDGTGFDPAYADEIFKPFRRLVARSQVPGTGMGLAVCRKIAQLHGGAIAATGQPGRGAVFTVRLPVAPAEAVAALAAALAAQ